MIKIRAIISVLFLLSIPRVATVWADAEAIPSTSLPEPHRTAPSSYENAFLPPLSPGKPKKYRIATVILGTTLAITVGFFAAKAAPGNKAPPTPSRSG